MYTRFFNPTWDKHVSNRSMSMSLDQAVSFMRDYVTAITENAQE